MRARKAGLSCEVLLASRRRAIWSLLHSATVEPLRTPLSSVRVCAARARKLGALVECREAGLGLTCRCRACGKLLAALVRSISQVLVPEVTQPQGAERSRCGRQRGVVRQLHCRSASHGRPRRPEACCATWPMTASQRAPQLQHWSAGRQRCGRSKLWLPGAGASARCVSAASSDAFSVAQTERHDARGVTSNAAGSTRCIADVARDEDVNATDLHPAVLRRPARRWP
jgi:hypothetical protein